MKPLIMTLAVLLMMGCKTKQIVKSSETQKEFEKVNSKKDSIQNEVKNQEKEVISEKKSTDQKKDSQTEIDIIGKAETDKPLEIFNIENGDTLQSLKVTGNANVIFRSKASKSNEVKTERKSESLVEKFKQFSENIVEENNVKERFKEVKNKTKDVKVKGFQAGTWIVITIVIFFLIFIFFIYKYFKK
ncbi:hypothetical protein [Chryseobacterium sp. 8AT]|uniref:hypothetical protein n=1 Tax=Chryseobacterium sp. 8AT TaxID=2653134 RepID=UPI0012F0951D|nr:hypothetical protein [Chryseobacterium sp. 8AT]VXB02422.1 conserved hypothetical protein [Chryseobacterium sp. 8AT]